MRWLADETLAAIGRMTVAATDLEHLLAQIGADRTAGDADALFARPGEPLRAARAAAGGAKSTHPTELIAYVEGAATQLAQSQAALRAMWRENGRTDAALYDEITARLLRCRDTLRMLATAE
jgi:hypothetical protein